MTRVLISSPSCYRWLVVLACLAELALHHSATAADTSRWSHLHSTLTRLHRRHGGDSPTEAIAPAECSEIDDFTDYRVSIHVVALVVIFVCSSLGAVIPILARLYPKWAIPNSVLECGKFLGAGVILATSLIHMLPGAVFNLTHPCVPESFRDYSAFFGLFAMLAILAFHLLEHLLTAHFMRQGATGAYQPAAKHQEPDLKGGEPLPSNTQTPHGSPRLLEQPRDDLLMAGADRTDGSPSTAASDKASDNAVGCHHRALDPEHEVLELHSHHTHVHGGALLDQPPHTLRASTYILEIGIAMHSVIIGLTLGTTSDSEFISLWVALVFHQFFEGVALGSRLADLNFKSPLVPLASALAFAITTPVGTAIGIGVRYQYQSQASTTLVVQGIFDAISGGILLYTALVNLIAQEFSQHQFHHQSLRRKTACFISMYVGAAVMAIIGKWA